MRIFVAVELTHDEGTRLTGETLLDLFESDGIADSVEDGPSLYRCRVLGIGRTAGALQESIKLRKQQGRQGSD